MSNMFARQRDSQHPPVTDQNLYEQYVGYSSKQAQHSPAHHKLPRNSSVITKSHLTRKFLEFASHTVNNVMVNERRGASQM